MPGDIELWVATKEGDRTAFGTLFRRHYSLLFNYGIKLQPDAAEVEDCIQELFVDIWRSPSSTKIESVKAYLLTALKYKLLRPGKNRSMPLDNTELPFELNVESFIEAREDEQHLTTTIVHALNRLPPRQKEIVYLRIFHGLGYDELASIMGINYQVCRNLFSQAIKSLREFMTQPVHK